MAMAAQARALAARLRGLRKEAWPDRPTVTQQQLATAFKVSVPLISSWENEKKPTVPSEEKLRNYAQFFATPRSIEGGKGRLIELDRLTETELARHHELAEELTGLLVSTRESPMSPSSQTAPAGASFWRFDDGAPVTIVCARLPDRLRANEALASPYSPDYVELFSYADLDALMELHGHIRAANPDTLVTRILAANATPNQLTRHLVVLGGVDWNPITREALGVLNIPVTQGYRDADDDEGAFDVVEGDVRSAFRPVLRTDEEGRRVLVEDVGHFYRGPNPFNQRRTLTICNAMFGRGVYGMVRTLTDVRFRDRNARYLRENSGPGDALSLLTRVRVVMGAVITPDWTDPNTVLHKWSETAS
jgi:transcriptional regulator with XRE-family HTH domain